MNYKSVTGKNWLFKRYDENYAKKICETFHFNETLSKIISIRKIELDQIENFINPTIKKNLPNPNSIKDMDVAINKTFLHIQKKKHLMYIKRSLRELPSTNPISLLQLQTRERNQVEKIFQENMLNNKQQKDLFILMQKILLKQRSREQRKTKI